MRRSMHPEYLSRSVVIGTSGSGKSTFARNLAAALRTSYIELDALLWGPNWTQNSSESIRANLRLEVVGETWVLDGNYSNASAEAWSAATAVVWLNYPFTTVFSRATRRTLTRIATQEKLFSDNRESIYQIVDPDWIPWWVLRTFWRRRREYQEMLSLPEFAHLQIFEFSRPRQAADFLSKLRAT